MTTLCQTCGSDALPRADDPTMADCPRCGLVEIGDDDQLSEALFNDAAALPEFRGFSDLTDKPMIALAAYGAGSCFGCGGTVGSYQEGAGGRVFDYCNTCGEVVQSPRMVNGKLQDGFEPGAAPAALRDEDVRY